MMRSNTVGLQRLRAHRLAGTRFTTPEEVVRWMGALQAQAYGQVVWAIGLRTHAATLAQVEQAIAERRILLTWPLRGTLHVAPAEDARWMLLLSEPRTRRGASRRLAQLDLTETILERCMTLFYDALRGGTRLTRAAMMTIVEEAGISTTGQRGYHILWQAAQRGLICLGPMEGAQQTFVLLDEWVPASRTLSREEAVAELARRYFSSHGPATLRDFAGWAGLTLTEARFGLDAVRADLVSRTIDTSDYWMSADAADSPVPDTATVFLLPGFDEYVLGYKDRGDVLAPGCLQNRAREQRDLPAHPGCRWPHRGRLDTATHHDDSRPHAASLYATHCFPRELGRGSTALQRLSGRAGHLSRHHWRLAVTPSLCCASIASDHQRVCPEI